MLTGDRPTGHLHIGHYLGSLRNRVTFAGWGIDRSSWSPTTRSSPTGRHRPIPRQRPVPDRRLPGPPASTPPGRRSSPTRPIPALNQLIVPFLALVTRAELNATPPSKRQLAASGRPRRRSAARPSRASAAGHPVCKATSSRSGRISCHIWSSARVLARRFNSRFAAARRFPRTRRACWPSSPSSSDWTVRRCPRATATPSNCAPAPPARRAHPPGPHRRRTRDHLRAQRRPEVANLSPSRRRSLTRTPQQVAARSVGTAPWP